MKSYPEIDDGQIFFVIRLCIENFTGAESASHVNWMEKLT